jgi:hypothetical protein
LDIVEKIETPLIFAVDPVTEETYPDCVKEICAISIHFHLGSILRALRGVELDPEFKEHIMRELIQNAHQN